MKIVVAPDSFKGALRAGRVAASFAAGWSEVRPQDTVIEFPLSDGGEGVCDALAGNGRGTVEQISVHDPLMREVMADIGFTEDFAVLESAGANGIELLKADELDPMLATTYGVGEALKELVSVRRCRKIIIGIGGSATVDCGAGMLQALGVKFFTADGVLLPDGVGGGDLGSVARVDAEELKTVLGDTELLVACDVTNVLTGMDGAAAVFGPQKGATPEMVAELDANLRSFAALFGDDGNTPGDGAAGGLGFAFRKILGAKICSGAELVMKVTGFAGVLEGADLVITGEGCSDSQSCCGKLCSVAAEAAAKAGVPVILVSGALRGERGGLEKLFDGCFSIADGPCSLSEAVEGTEKNLRSAGRNFAALAGALKDRSKFYKTVK